MNGINEANDLNKTSDDKKRQIEEARRAKLLKVNSNFNHSNTSYAQARMKNSHIEIDDELNIHSQTSQVRAPIMGMSSQCDLPLDLIVPYEHQVRKAFDQDKLKELALDIKKRGVQTPIKVFKTLNGKYAVYNGERRFRASHMAGATSIPAIITNESAALVDSFQDNEKRENLNILSRALYFQLLIDRSICQNPQEIAELLSISDKIVYEGLSFVNKLNKTDFERLIQIPNLGRAEIRGFIKAQDKGIKTPVKEKTKTKYSLQVTFNDHKATIAGMEQMSASQLDALAEAMAGYLQ